MNALGWGVHSDGSAACAFPLAAETSWRSCPRTHGCPVCACSWKPDRSGQPQQHESTVPRRQGIHASSRLGLGWAGRGLGWGGMVQGRQGKGMARAWPGHGNESGRLGLMSQGAAGCAPAYTLCAYASPSSGAYVSPAGAYMCPAGVHWSGTPGTLTP